jgi:trimethylamine-N-oxide reductase (cytochrome c)
LWVTEGTYDKAYVATHTVGFDKIEDYVLGKVDGVPKTPKWASAKCGVPAWTIKALARDWAQKIVTIGHYFAGGMARGPYSHEPARLECVILGMQGLGKPGVHQAQIASPPCKEQHRRRQGPLGTFEKRSARRPANALESAPRHAVCLGQASDPEDPHRRGHPQGPSTFWAPRPRGRDLRPVKKYTYPIAREKGAPRST